MTELIETDEKIVFVHILIPKIWTLYGDGDYCHALGMYTQGALLSVHPYTHTIIYALDLNDPRRLAVTSSGQRRRT